MKKLIAAVVFVSVFAAGAQAQENKGVVLGKEGKAMQLGEVAAEAIAENIQQTIENIPPGVVLGREGKAMQGGEVAVKIVKAAIQNAPKARPSSDNPADGYVVPGREGRAMEVGIIFKNMFKKKEAKKTAERSTSRKKELRTETDLNVALDKAVKDGQAQAAQRDATVVCGNPRCHENIYQYIQDMQSGKQVKPGQYIPLEKYPRHREAKESVGK